MKRIPRAVSATYQAKDIIPAMWLDPDIILNNILGIAAVALHMSYVGRAPDPATYRALKVLIVLTGNSLQAGLDRMLERADDFNLRNVLQNLTSELAGLLKLPLSSDTIVNDYGDMLSSTLKEQIDVAEAFLDRWSPHITEVRRMKKMKFRRDVPNGCVPLPTSESAEALASILLAFDVLVHSSKTIPVLGRAKDVPDIEVRLLKDPMAFFLTVKSSLGVGVMYRSQLPLAYALTARERDDRFSEAAIARNRQAANRYVRMKDAHTRLVTGVPAHPLVRVFAGSIATMSIETEYHDAAPAAVFLGTRPADSELDRYLNVYASDIIEAYGSRPTLTDWGGKGDTIRSASEVLTYAQFNGMLAGLTNDVTGEWPALETALHWRTRAIPPWVYSTRASPIVVADETGLSHPQAVCLLGLLPTLPAGHERERSTNTWVVKNAAVNGDRPRFCLTRVAGRYSGNNQRHLLATYQPGHAHWGGNGAQRLIWTDDASSEAPVVGVDATITTDDNPIVAEARAYLGSLNPLFDRSGPDDVDESWTAALSPRAIAATPNRVGVEYKRTTFWAQLASTDLPTLRVAAEEASKQLGHLKIVMTHEDPARAYAPYELQPSANACVYVYGKSGKYLVRSGLGCVLAGGPVTKMTHKYDIYEIVSDAMMPADVSKAQKHSWDVTKVVEIDDEPGEPAGQAGEAP